jgi:hypothetical protein
LENLRGLAFEPCDSINNKWDKITHRIYNVASEVLGNIAVEHHNDWYDEECQIATERKNNAYAIMQQRSYKSLCGG